MKQSQLTLALCVAMLAMRADAADTLENLQNKLIELKEEANAIQARADAEKRELTEDEEKEIEQIFASFESVEADIERRERIEAINAKVATPGKRKTAPDDVQNRGGDDDDEGKRNKPKSRVIVATSNERDLRGKWGFRSQAEFLSAVVASSAKGGSIDPRLIANAPTTYGSEGAGADGGFAVPPDFRSAIVSKIMGEDSLLSLTDQQTSSSNSFTCPADETSPWQSSGGIQAYWESEGGQKGQSKPKLTEKTVKLNKVIALVPLTDELLEDAPSMANYVGRKAPEKINFKVNDAIINGTGVGMPLGILNSPGTITVAAESGQAADSVLFQNILNMWGRLTPSARRNAKWLANPDVEQQLMGMQFPGTGTAVPVYLPPGGLSAAPYGTLLGRPIVTTEAAPALGDAGDLILGDMQSYLSLTKGSGIRQDVSIHIWFDYDITAFRFVLRIGGQPWWNTAIEPFHAGGNSRGFFVALGARD
jgi:HK97 family phage major capsid protein